MSVPINDNVRPVGLLLGCLVAALVFAVPQVALAQPLKPLAKPNRVTQLIENRGSITLVMQSQLPVSAPAIGYLRSPDGTSRLFADFPGVVWPYQARHIRIEQDQSPSHPESRLENPCDLQSINFGQFQDSPPIFRITVDARSNRCLKNISFQATSGRLSLAWEKNAAMQKENQAALPLASTASSPYRLVFTTESLPNGRATNDTPPELPVSSAAPIDTSAYGQSAPLAESLTPVPSLSLVGGRLPQITLHAAGKITYKSFRLSEPERFVVDLENLVGLEQSVVPELPANDLLANVRVGARHDRSPSGRLVCDLTSDTTVAQTELSEDGQTLTVSFSKGPIVSAAQLPSGVRILLDPGHGGSDPGAQRGLTQEKEITLAIVHDLQNMLEARGIKVYLTRDDDNFVSLEDRARLTNSLMPDLFVSVHINSLPTDSDLSGIETYYQTASSRLLADCIHESLVNHLEAADRSVRKARFYVINHTTVPAVLAEVGFISCKDEREKLISSEYQNRVAKALEHGVILYLAKQSELVRKENAHQSLLTSNQAADGGNNRLAENKTDGQKAK